MTFTLLGHRLTLPQPPHGHRRPPEDALWLAATLTPPEHATVLDAGCGAGVAGLALLTRHPTLHITGVDISPQLTISAMQAALLNNHTTYRATTANFLTYTPEHLFDITLSNPPFHAAERGHTSPDTAIQTAHGSPHGQLTAWLHALHRCTASNGLVAVILHAACETELKTFHATTGGTLHLYPLQTAEDKPAKRIIAHLHKGTPTATHTHPVIPAWQATLRQCILTDAQALPLT